MSKRAMVLAAFGLAAACEPTAASAHVDVGVYLGPPAPVYAPPPVIYAPPPPVVYAPPPRVYYGRGDYWRVRAGTIMDIAAAGKGITVTAAGDAAHGHAR